MREFSNNSIEPGISDSGEKLQGVGGMCALFYENRLGIKKSWISFVYLFCPKFRLPYHSNHVIPHRDKAVLKICQSSSLTA